MRSFHAIQAFSNECLTAPGDPKISWPGLCKTIFLRFRAEPGDLHSGRDFPRGAEELVLAIVPGHAARLEKLVDV